ncbi:MaoC/PaaZ C-terminal domain-containing protein [Dietzia cercidiphylli]|uniref:MaoC/PaaZ C-terminal domain-containing protein n=1 Tax=Dietzia cercidiphylli TaxID=498199 RepID=UPI00223A8B72|nr:MaoC/PaaZ C-terminal domain-containing protein [Dietzia cercidiphylli]MCT1516048.1 MaoC family dehydratase N-terminal domain-containing protein [Dietzia cercidiphylli]
MTTDEPTSTDNPTTDEPTRDEPTTTRRPEPGEPIRARSLPVTRADLRRYADASGDHNPIHLSGEAARELGLPGVVAHGMLTSALAIGVVAEWAGGADRVVATSIRFAGPVVVPADAPALLEVAGTVRRVAADGSTADVALTVTCGGAKVFGKAIVTVALDGADRAI